VFTPITFAARVHGGPPEFPGLSAASVAARVDQAPGLGAQAAAKRGSRRRSDRVLEAVRIAIAIASCPTRRPRDEPSTTLGSAFAPTRTTAMSYPDLHPAGRRRG